MLKTTLTLALALCSLVSAGALEAFANDENTSAGTKATANAACCQSEKCANCSDARACEHCRSSATMRLGAVAYAPSAVTIFEGMRRYFAKHDFPVDYVLYSNYDSLGAALVRGEVDIAWNTPLAHARYHCQSGETSQTLVMRDVDCNFRSVLVARKDAGVTSLAGLKGATLVLGSNQAAEATVLPVHFLKGEGVEFDELEIVSLDGEEDLHGNPCSSEKHVLAALKEGRGTAGIIGQRMWQRLVAQHGDDLPFVEVWTSPAFSHCVFTASDEFDQAKADRFRELMLAMDPEDPQTADVMRLEGTKKWVPGSPDGFHELVKALGEQ